MKPRALVSSAINILPDKVTDLKEIQYIKAERIPSEMLSIGARESINHGCSSILDPRGSRERASLSGQRALSRSLPLPLPFLSFFCIRSNNASLPSRIGKKAAWEIIRGRRFANLSLAGISTRIIFHFMSRLMDNYPFFVLPWNLV